jgi:hypothetical protein
MELVLPRNLQGAVLSEVGLTLPEETTFEQWLEVVWMPLTRGSLGSVLGDPKASSAFVNIKVFQDAFA